MQNPNILTIRIVMITSSPKKKNISYKTYENSTKIEVKPTQ